METEDETMGALFRAMDVATKERKATREVTNMAALEAAGMDNYMPQGKNVLRFQTLAGAVMYYPATNCWQHKGKTCRGDVQAFVAWYKKQTFTRPS